MTTTIVVKVTLSGTDDAHELQQEFLHKIPEKIGKATIYALEIVQGGVDADGVPIKNNITLANLQRQLGQLERN